jgi:hypothetical protein
LLEIGDVHGAAQCLQSLGYVLRMQAKYTEAFDTWTEARRQLLEIGDVAGAADCSERLDDVPMRAKIKLWTKIRLKALIEHCSLFVSSTGNL